LLYFFNEEIKKEKWHNNEFSKLNKKVENGETTIKRLITESKQQKQDQKETKRLTPKKIVKNYSKSLLKNNRKIKTSLIN
jgi:hypothetical protein